MEGEGHVNDGEKRPLSRDAQEAQRLTRQDVELVMDMMLAKHEVPFTITEITKRLGLPKGSTNIYSAFRRYGHTKWKRYAERLRSPDVPPTDASAIED